MNRYFLFLKVEEKLGQGKITKVYITILIKKKNQYNNSNYTWKINVKIKRLKSVKRENKHTEIKHYKWDTESSQRDSYPHFIVKISYFIEYNFKLKMSVDKIIICSTISKKSDKLL